MSWTIARVDDDRFVLRQPGTRNKKIMNRQQMEKYIMTTLNVHLCRSNARMPTYATQGSACFDLYAAGDQSVELTRHAPVVIPTGLKFDIPEGYVLMVYSRSGHGFKNDIRLANCVGIIDSDYTDEVMVKLTKDGVNRPLIINPGDRIAQAILVPVQQVSFFQTDEPPAQKGNRTGGFGSTGA